MFEGGCRGKNSNAASVDREVPLKDRVFKILKNLCMVFDQIARRLRRCPFICIFPKTQRPVAEACFSLQSLYFFSERGTRHDRTQDKTQSNVGRNAIERRRAFAKK